MATGRARTRNKTTSSAANDFLVFFGGGTSYDVSSKGGGGLDGELVPRSVEGLVPSGADEEKSESGIFVSCVGAGVLSMYQRRP